MLPSDDHQRHCGQMIIVRPEIGQRQVEIDRLQMGGNGRIEIRHQPPVRYPDRWLPPSPASHGLMESREVPPMAGP